jgi:hypothetical protein
MNIAKVEKKLREAQFFLGKMVEQERKAFGDKEPFDFYLSALLSAGRTVDYRLRHEQAKIYPTWRAKWDANLNSSDQGLIKFMVGDRNVEVHESGSNRAVKTEDIEIGNSYSDASGTIEVSAPPGTPSPVISQPSYSFLITGAEHKVTDACSRYVELLELMIARFKGDHP